MIDVTDDWVSKQLGELTYNFDSQRIPVKEADRRQGPYPYYGASGIVDYVDDFIFDGEYLLIAEDGENLRTRNTPVAFLANGKYWVNNHAHIVRGNELADTRFLLYAILNADIGAYLTGSTMPKLTQGNLNRLQILTPSLCEQRAIAATLSALDDKIELNNRINKTLEEMAQALFKRWFVDFEFPDENGQPYKSSGGEMEESELGPIPKGWKVGCIGNYAKIKSGFAFKSSWWQASGVPVIKIKEISDATINFNNVSFVAEDKIQTAKEFYVTGGELLIAMTGATIGKFALVPKIKQGALVNQRVGKFFLGNSPLKKAGFLYCLLKKEEIFNEIVSRGDGSAQPNISPTAIETIKIVYPSEYYILQFNHAVYSSFEMIISNMYENSKLEKLRDALLPKLMSGEIRVPIEEVAADV